MTLPSSRLMNALGLFGAIFSMLFALIFLQGYLDLDPCPLCVVDRILVISIGILFLLAFLHNPKRKGQRAYATLIALVAIVGIGVCWRHIWLQNLPADLVPSCGPGLDYMLETLPLAETLKIIFTGSGECADTQWTFLGLSIPIQTLLVFIGFLVLSLTQWVRKSD